MKKSELENMPTIAVYYGGLWDLGAEIKALENESIGYIWRAGDTQTAHVKRIYYTANNAYFLHDGRRVRLSEVLRV